MEFVIAQESLSSSTYTLYPQCPSHKVITCDAHEGVYDSLPSRFVCITKELLRGFYFLQLFLQRGHVYCVGENSERVLRDVI